MEKFVNLRYIWQDITLLVDDDRIRIFGSDLESSWNFSLEEFKEFVYHCQKMLREEEIKRGLVNNK